MALLGYFTHLGILVCIYAILAVSLNLALGFTGLLNLGHIAFFGIGAYVAALLGLAGLSPWIDIPLAVVIAALVGVILAIPTARLKGDYLALATLGFTFIISSVARNWTSLTRGALGLPGIPRLGSISVVLAFVAGFALLCFLVVVWISRSSLGRKLQAIRDDELAAQVLGTNTFLYKLIAMGISAAMAGLAGAWYAHYISFIDPSIFSIPDLILLIAMVVVGGLASVRGAFIGTVIILLLPEPLRFIGFPPTLIGPAREMLFALVLLLILLFRPRGILGKVDIS
ncbi:MAG TPA: branched-chain amino acid ABC transporter permease [Candidatus Binatia bacterium]|nr:branched-chain amino acid ABC transporter permease [Candidatus Binatia bacterium]